MGQQSPHHARLDHCKSSVLRTYIRTAFIFWVIFVITWMPSSINRVYSLVQANGAPSYALSMLSCITLPLQGFWNAVVFTMVGLRGWKVKETALSRLSGWRVKKNHSGLPLGVERRNF
jgi:G protein-coupled glucose receptor regulating Gpa2 C-term